MKSLHKNIDKDKKKYRMKKIPFIQYEKKQNGVWIYSDGQKLVFLKNSFVKKIQR